MFFKNLKKIWAAAAALLLFASPVYAAAAEGFPEKLVPMGNVIGINLQTRGVVVAGVGEVETENGTVAPAKDAGLRRGDVILAVNGSEVDSVEDLTAEFSSCGEKASVKILREGEERQLTVEPYHSEGHGSIGVWVRDELNGIGTLTFYDAETGIFGALGHSVSDVDTGAELEFKGGVIAPATVEGVTAGQPGTPGQLGGVFTVEDAYGVIITNGERGVYGELDDIDASGALELGEMSEIKVGPATILSTVSGSEVEEYDVEIMRVYPDEGETRNMMIKVTDEELLSVTGGIVQGMSGSPIIQDGKLIGAVTHVLISDPTKGYGIAIENMLEAAY